VDDEINHEGTEGTIVCPWCGHEQEDTDYCSNRSYEGDEECDACGKTYHYFAEFTIEWYTRKVEKPDPISTRS
jgi:hypothetical protein